jgi:hypothetical protein
MKRYLSSLILLLFIIGILMIFVLSLAGCDAGGPKVADYDPDGDTYVPLEVAEFGDCDDGEAMMSCHMRVLADVFAVPEELFVNAPMVAHEVAFDYADVSPTVARKVAITLGTHGFEPYESEDDELAPRNSVEYHPIMPTPLHAYASTDTDGSRARARFVLGGRGMSRIIPYNAPSRMFAVNLPSSHVDGVQMSYIVISPIAMDETLADYVDTIAQSDFLLKSCGWKRPDREFVCQKHKDGYDYRADISYVAAAAGSMLSMKWDISRAE